MAPHSPAEAGGPSAGAGCADGREDSSVSKARSDSKAQKSPSEEKTPTAKTSGAAGDGKRRATGKKDTFSGLTQREATLIRHNPWLAQIPLLTPKMCEPRAEPSLAAVTSHIAKHWPSDFCWSSSFEPSFIALLMYEGYLPTAHGPVEGPVEYILLPKLHQERCIVLFEDLHVPRNVRSNSRDYQLSVDMAFDEVVEKCLAQHGESWLHPPIVDGFKHLSALAAHRE